MNIEGYYFIVQHNMKLKYILEKEKKNLFLWDILKYILKFFLVINLLTNKKIIPKGFWKYQLFRISGYIYIFFIFYFWYKAIIIFINIKILLELSQNN